MTDALAGLDSTAPVVVYCASGYRSQVGAARDRLWVAMARESAHQLGTPLMGLTGWIAYVRENPGTTAEELAGSVSGTILPFSFRPDLELLADPAILANREIFFNAARLDRSIALSTADWTAVATPRVERIAG